MLINSWTAKHKCKHKLYWTTPDSTLDKSRVKNYDFVMSFKFFFTLNPLNDICFEYIL